MRHGYIFGVQCQIESQQFCSVPNEDTITVAAPPTGLQGPGEHPTGELLFLYGPLKSTGGPLWLFVALCGPSAALFPLADPPVAQGSRGLR